MSEQVKVNAFEYIEKFNNLLHKDDYEEVYGPKTFSGSLTVNQDYTGENRPCLQENVVLEKSSDKWWTIPTIKRKMLKEKREEEIQVNPTRNSPTKSILSIDFEKNWFDFCDDTELYKIDYLVELGWCVTSSSWNSMSYDFNIQALNKDDELLDMCYRSDLRSARTRNNYGYIEIDDFYISGENIQKALNNKDCTKIRVEFLCYYTYGGTFYIKEIKDYICTAILKPSITSLETFLKEDEQNENK